MTEYVAPIKDMMFVLRDAMGAEKLWESLPKLEGVIDIETSEAILEEAGKMASQVLAPLNRSGDEEGAIFNNGEVKTPEGFIDAYKQYAEGGWCGLGGNPEFGGMGMPKTLAVLFEEMMYSANNSFTLYPCLTVGSTLAVDAHGSQAIKETYLPKFYSGEWAGTMCLTEPHCGTDLGIMKTKAQPNADGSYSITGTKIFITGGEHDLTDNIVHLVLAKIEGAPAGTKGISLFVVPKFMLDENGEMTDERNPAFCGSIEHKMGIKASATCVMNFDGAKGWLVGEENRGLAAMFTMMNYERLSIGIQGQGCSEMAYQGAVEYAKDRLQSRSPTGKAFPEKSADPIIVHPDIRRMLLNIRSTTEAGRAFSVYVAKYLDQVKFGEDAETAKKAMARIALLTPVAKAFFTDIGLQNTIDGQQCYGGHGYIREWGMEQLVRDVRIAQIYEGTNGIQALDLMGRKIAADGGSALKDYFADARADIDAAQSEQIAGMCSAAKEAIDTAERVATAVLTNAQANPAEIGAASVEYLHLLGYAIYGHMWVLMAAAAQKVEDKDFADTKLKTANYFFKRILPRIKGLEGVLLAGAEPMMELAEEAF